jgi:hypothetical protein
MQPQIVSIMHAVEYFLKKIYVFLRYLHLAQAEMNGRHQVVKFNRFKILLDDFTNFRAIPFIFFEYYRVVNPYCGGLIGRQMTFGWLA